MVDQYLVILQQTLDYFGILPGVGGGGGQVVRFVNADRIPKFYDNLIIIINNLETLFRVF